MGRALTKTGRYQLVSELGRGSMGVVYQGFDPVIGRTVAIKTMLIEGLSTTEFQEFKARFQREAQAAGILAHPNIVTVYDFGEDEGVLFLAMEYLDGKSLQQLVEKQNVMPVETIIPMFEQVCSALDHAHSHNIVHRDIKPANIMILDSGLVKVTDFGIAKIMSMGMTQAGQILGTPNYMSPEQVKGRPVDGRSDIFSLGVILYELVTGEKPFGGQNITTVIYKIINENPIPPRELDATIHPGLSFVISKALAKSPEERFQTCRELAENLKNYKNLGGVTAPSATVVIKVPPIQAPPPEVAPATPPAAPARAPARKVQAPAAEPQRAQPSAPGREQRPSRQIPPPAFAAIKAEPRGTSPAVWVLLALILIGGVGGGGYYFLFVKNAANLAPNNPAVAPNTTGTTSPNTATPASGESPSETQATGTRKSQGGETNQPVGAGGNAPNAPSKTETRPPETAEKPASVLKYGQLIVSSNPAGAQITVDGRSDPDWETPHTIDGLTAGFHTVILSREGYASKRQNVSVEAGRTRSLNIELASLHAPPPTGRPVTPPPQPKVEEPTSPAPESTSATGVLVIQTDPPGAEVFIDGRSYGPSPVRQVLPVGEHSYAIKQSGVEIFSNTLQLGPGKVEVRRLNLGTK